MIATDDAPVVVARYSYRVYADAIARDLQGLGITAVVLPMDGFGVAAGAPIGSWDVAVPASAAARARMVAEGVPGY